MGILRFVGAVVVAGFLVSITSLLWPRVLQSPRPDALNKVHDVVLGTQVGQRMADVLGVSDEAHIEPIYVGEAAQSVGVSVLGVIESRARYVILTQAIRQIMTQYERLPLDQQDSLRTYICSTQSSTFQKDE